MSLEILPGMEHWSASANRRAEMRLAAFMRGGKRQRCALRDVSILTYSVEHRGLPTRDSVGWRHVFVPWRRRRYFRKADPHSVHGKDVFCNACDAFVRGRDAAMHQYLCPTIRLFVRLGGATCLDHEDCLEHPELGRECFQRTNGGSP